MLSNSTRLVSAAQIIPANVPSWFSYSYDPAGGVNGQGRLSVTITNSTPFTYSLFVDLTAPDRSQGAVIDAFGVGGTIANTVFSNRGDLFVDDLIYTAIPEPASLVLLAFGAVALLRCRTKQVE